MSTDTPAAAPTAERQLRAALALAREYVLSATHQTYDGTGGNSIRAEAKRHLSVIDAALSAPVAAQPAASGVTKVADAARVLAEFAKTAPGRLPSRVQEAVEVALSTALTGAAKE